MCGISTIIKTGVGHDFDLAFKNAMSALVNNGIDDFDIEKFYDSLN